MDIDVVALQALMTQVPSVVDMAQGTIAAQDPEITCEICRCDW